MLINIWIETARHYYNDGEDFVDEGHYEYVDVPLKDIAKILAERFGIDENAMHDIICEFDLEEQVADDEDVLELAYEIYRNECDAE